MKNPLVSVIIPAFNRAECIGNTIESIANQDYRPLDIIVIDDGSTDNTKNVVQKFCKITKDLSVRYYYQENGGVSSARNRGIGLAKGEFISFCDSDDILMPRKISKQIALMQKEGADVSYGQVCYKSDECTWFNHPKPASDDPALQFLYYETLSPNDSWMFAKELFKFADLRFREGCAWGEDNEFLCRALFLAKKSVYLDFCTAEITVGRNDGLSKFSWDKAGRDIYIYEKIREWLVNHAKSHCRRKRYQDTINYYTIPMQIINRAWRGKADKKGAKEIMELYRKYTSFWNVLHAKASVNKFKLLVKIILLKFYLQ